MVERAFGYAIVHNGEVIVKTISPTERAAKVNWLVVEFGLAVTRWATDRSIENAWLNHKGSAECRRVQIEVVDA